VLVDGGAAVNLLPHCLLIKIGLSETDLKPHNVVLCNYEGKSGSSLGAIEVDLVVGTVKRPTLFLVVESKANYNLLLGREWIHGVGVVLLSMHQRLSLWKDNGVLENIEADQSYFVAEVANITKKTFDKQLARIGPCPISVVGYENHGRFLWSMKLHPRDGFIWKKECVEDDMMRTRASMYASPQPGGILKLESPRLGGKMSALMMTEPNVWEKITAYVAENNEKAALEVEIEQERSIKDADDDFRFSSIESQRLDCIYEPLGFEKDPLGSTKKMKAQDPLEEVDLGDGSTKRPTYISTKIDKDFKVQIVEFFRKYKDCFAWDYNEIAGLNRDVVELKLPIQPDKKPVKQTPRGFAPQIQSKIKEEIERLLKCGFIRTARYVDWLANIVLVVKKSRTLRVCIDFRYLNLATPKDEYPIPKDEYPMPVAEMLVD